MNKAPRTDLHQLSFDFGSPGPVQEPEAVPQTGDLTAELSQAAEQVLPAIEPAPSDADVDVDETPFVLTDEERGLMDRAAMTAKASLLADRLREKFGLMSLSLTITDNRLSVVNFRLHSQKSGAELRLHHMFLNAPDGVLDDLVTFAKGGSDKKPASRRLDEFIQKNSDLLRSDELSPARIPKMTPEGRFRDLSAIFERLNRLYFAGKIEAAIGWGRLPLKRNKKTIRFGAYFPATRTIRIHPVLDAPDVPDFFVDYVVFHEMLHQAFPSTEDANGRRTIHTPEFLAAESAYPDFQRAERWSRDNLRRLFQKMPLRRPSTSAPKHSRRI